MILKEFGGMPLPWLSEVHAGITGWAASQLYNIYITQLVNYITAASQLYNIYITPTFGH